jgi:transposase-like protein
MRVSATDRQAKFEIIEQWKKSGLAQKEFYQQQNITAHVFYYWHKCYRDQQKKQSVKASGNFVQLVSAASAAGIEVQLPNGTRIFFNQPVSSDFLKALID